MVDHGLARRLNLAGGPDLAKTSLWYFIFMVKYGQFPEMVRSPTAYVIIFHRT